MEKWFFIWQNLKKLQSGELVNLADKDCKFFEYVARDNHGNMVEHIRKCYDQLRSMLTHLYLENDVMPFVVGFYTALELLLHSARKKEG